MIGLLPDWNIGSVFSYVFGAEENRTQAADLYAVLTEKAFVSPGRLSAEAHGGNLVMHCEGKDLITIHDFTSLIGLTEEVPFSALLWMWDAAMKVREHLNPDTVDASIPLFTVVDLPEKLKPYTFSLTVSLLADDQASPQGGFDFKDCPLNLNPVQKLPYLKTCLALQAYNHFRLQLNEVIQAADSREETMGRIAALIEEDAWPHVFLNRHRDEALEIIMNQIDLQIAAYEICDFLTGNILTLGVCRHLQRRYVKKSSRIREFQKLYPSWSRSAIKEKLESLDTYGLGDNSNVHF
ncbi:MAG: hypothetical protein IKD69_15045 [Solobacterium sp.]|nr:hypothetical protein [Solobacterium sp.]